MDSATGYKVHVCCILLMDDSSVVMNSANGTVVVVIELLPNLGKATSVSF